MVNLVSFPNLGLEYCALYKQRKCKGRLFREIGAVFVPCGHFSCCGHCAPALEDCRQLICDIIKVYISKTTGHNA
jgi:hypothetical protein